MSEENREWGTHGGHERVCSPTPSISIQVRVASWRENGLERYLSVDSTSNLASEAPWESSSYELESFPPL